MELLLTDRRKTGGRTSFLGKIRGSVLFSTEFEMSIRHLHRNNNTYL